MKLRYRLAIIAAITAVIPLGLARAANASPITNGGKICNSALTKVDYFHMCLKSNGYQNILYVTDAGSLTNFVAINPITWQGHTNDVYEYKQSGTGNCLEFDSSHNLWGEGVVRMDTCRTGAASQHWWLSGSGNLVNDYATAFLNQQACLDIAPYLNTWATVVNGCSNPNYQYFQINSNVWFNG